MPCVSVVKTHLFHKLGKTFSDDEFSQLCFEVGMELDDVVEDHPNYCNQTVYTIEVASNRSDLLCTEGIALALNVFLGNQSIPRFTLQSGEGTSTPSVTVTVKKECSQIRPYVFGAILRNINFTETSYKSFIEFQTNICRNLGRERTFFAIGAHDLDGIQKGDISYEALPPREIAFQPLGFESTVNGEELVKQLENHQQLRAYLPLLEGSPVYPIIYDSSRVVLSLPPLINSEHTKVTLNTKNVFIDLTATDLLKGESALNILVALFSEYCTPKYSVEPVYVKYEEGHKELGGKQFLYPNLQERTMTCSVKNLSRLTGIPSLCCSSVCDLLRRIMIASTKLDQHRIMAHLPITRPDIMHEVDVGEGAALAYGFDNIPESDYQFIPSSSESTDLTSFRLKLTELLVSTHHEVINFKLCSTDEGYTLTNRIQATQPSPIHPMEYDPTRRPAVLANPKTTHFQIVRPSLAAGLLRAVGANRARRLPMKLFEIGDIVCEDNTTDTGMRNLLYCGLITAGKNAPGFEVTQASVISLMESIGIGYAGDQPNHSATRTFKFVECEDKLFSFGAHINVQPDNVNVGVIGVVNPLVLKNFKVDLSVSLAEINLHGPQLWTARNERS